MAETGQHQLKIGDSISLKRGFLRCTALVYAGMPNDRTLSLAVVVTQGNRGWAYNLYLPTDQRHIDIAGVPITLHSVGPTTVHISTD
jgi:hypothetical protein